MFRDILPAMFFSFLTWSLDGSMWRTGLDNHSISWGHLLKFIERCYLTDYWWTLFRFLRIASLCFNPSNITLSACIRHFPACKLYPRSVSRTMGVMRQASNAPAESQFIFAHFSDSYLETFAYQTLYCPSLLSRPPQKPSISVREAHGSLNRGPSGCSNSKSHIFCPRSS